MTLGNSDARVYNLVERHAQMLRLATTIMTGTYNRQELKARDREILAEMERKGRERK
jgi:hypothetical protein